jgi:hypothetical protein
VESILGKESMPLYKYYQAIMKNAKKLFVLDFQTSFSHVLDDPIAIWLELILVKMSSGFSLVGTVFQNYKHEFHFYSGS